MSTKSFFDRLKDPRPILVDGATGTELTRRGADTRLPLWSARALVDAPATVLEIHRDYVAAGAEIITANTFRTHRRSLAHGGLGAQARHLTRLAVDLARDAARGEGGRVFVAGSLSPLEDCYRPDLVPDDAALATEHAEMAKDLAEAGVDLLLVETMNTVREAWVATAAAKSTGLPVLSSVITGLDASSLLSGEPLAAAVSAIVRLRPDALLVNCVPARRMEAPLRALVEAAGRGFRIGAYGNIGHADDVNGWSPSAEVPPEEYARLAAEWLRAGATIIGGCCGTTPAHIAALRRIFN